MIRSVLCSMDLGGFALQECKVEVDVSKIEWAYFVGPMLHFGVSGKEFCGVPQGYQLDSLLSDWHMVKAQEVL